MKPPLLICTVGLPRSGKSTWAMMQGYPVVNPDSVRLALLGQAFIPKAEQMVWAMTKYMVSALFIAGHSQVILDATNTTRKRRDMWQSEEWETRFMRMDTPYNTCLSRAEDCGFPLEVIQDMHAKFDPLEEDEIEL